MTTSEGAIGIGELSRRANCKVETIRYYEHKGLMPQPPRTAGGHRVYSRGLAERLHFIRRCRQLGFSMDEIRGLLSLMDDDDLSCEKVKSIAQEHLEDIREKIADLKKMQDTLGRLAAQCTGDNVPECAIMQVLYRH